ncbi:MAG TPA: hydrogenase maturation nickel metallochaperone HypA [Gallionella sp.]|nr:hydrogenase maturation nickel metallochaperone HypA [Gallionella sp.]
MHEMSLAENVREIIEDTGRKQGFARVVSVRLEIGKLSSVEPEAMRFCFDAAMAGSIAGQAKLEIVETPGQGHCEDCGLDMGIESLYEACLHCGGYRIRVTGGGAMRIMDLEVE